MLSKEGGRGGGGIGGSDGLLLYNVNTPATDPTCQHVLAKGGGRVFQNTQYTEYTGILQHGETNYVCQGPCHFVYVLYYLVNITHMLLMLHVSVFSRKGHLSPNASCYMFLQKHIFMQLTRK